MKSIRPLVCDDDAILVNIAHNRRLKSYDNLRNMLAAFNTTYREYVRAAGDPRHAAPPQVLPPLLRSAIVEHFKRPPKVLIESLRAIRNTLSTEVCPMCGSLGIGTIDHVFPQAVYAELSFHTKNMVPACICNSLRQDVHWDGMEARVLHPYFDQVLDRRLVLATILPPFDSPTIGLEICCGNIPLRSSVEFHVNHVLSRTNVRNFIRHQWVMLRRRHEIVPELTGNVLTDASFEIAIDTALLRTDTEFGTPNNWKSMFFAGLLESPAARQYAMLQINDIKRGLVQPEDI